MAAQPRTHTPVASAESGRRPESGQPHFSRLAMANGDQGDNLEMAENADRSVQVSGTFGAGGTVLIEGSLDGVNFYSLTDPQGNALSFTSAKIEAITEIVRYIRPRVSNGDGTTSVNVMILASRGYK